MAEYSWSNKQLLYVFVVSLAAFSVLRWDMDAWFASKVDAAITAEHLPIAYKTINAHIYGVDLSQVNLKLAGMPNDLLLKSVQIRLNWESLWHAEVAFDVSLSNDFLRWHSLLSLQDDKLILRDIDADVDVQKAQIWSKQNAIFQAEGTATVQGDLTLHQASGAPLSVSLLVLWKHASINLLDQHYALGDYHLQLTKQQWELEGGSQLSLHGKGVLQVSEAPLLQWSLNGSVEVSPQTQSAVGRLVPASSIQLSGTLGKPRW